MGGGALIQMTRRGNDHGAAPPALMGLAQLVGGQGRHLRSVHAKRGMAVSPMAIQQATQLRQGKLQGIFPLLIQSLQGELLLSLHLPGRQQRRLDHLPHPVQEGRPIRGHAAQTQHHPVFPGAGRKIGAARLQLFRQGYGILTDCPPLNGTGQQVGLSPLPRGIPGAAPGNPPAQGH